MRALIFLRSPARARQLALALEDLGEEWQADWTCEASAARARLWSGKAGLMVLEDAEPGLENPLLASLAQRPPLPPPWTLYLGRSSGRVDAALSPEGTPAEWASAAQAITCGPGLPCLCAPLLPHLTAMAGELLEELGLRAELRAAAFLPEMIAWCAVHPPMLDAVTKRLYPCFSERYALRPGAVERDVRSALESLWSRGSLPALEKWFGHTVDPEKGRPTNREFLALTAEHVRRLAQKSEAMIHCQEGSVIQ